MIITSVIVLAIVGSAFAFKAKKLIAYCVTDSAFGTPPSCYVIVPSKRTTNLNTGVQLRYYPTWDGDLTPCQAGGQNTCTVGGAFRFVHD